MASFWEDSPRRPGIIIHDPNAARAMSSQGLEAPRVWVIRKLNSTFRWNREPEHLSVTMWGQQRGQKLAPWAEIRRVPKRAPQSNPTMIFSFIGLHNQYPARLHGPNGPQEGPYEAECWLIPSWKGWRRSRSPRVRSRGWSILPTTWGNSSKTRGHGFHDGKYRSHDGTAWNTRQRTSVGGICNNNP